MERYQKKSGANGQNSFSVEHKGFHDLDELMASIPGVMVVSGASPSLSTKYYQCPPERVAHALKEAREEKKQPTKGKSKKISMNGIVSPASTTASRCSVASDSDQPQVLLNLALVIVCLSNHNMSRQNPHQSRICLSVTTSGLW